MCGGTLSATCAAGSRKLYASPRQKCAATDKCRCCNRTVERAYPMNRIFGIQPGFCPSCKIRYHDAYLRTHGQGHPACAPTRSRNEIEKDGAADA